MAFKISNNIWFYILLAFIMVDTSYSFIQHLNMPLDGDMAGGIVPATEVQKILNDPFGISVLTRKDLYPNPNKFFCHQFFYSYFRTIPFVFQKITNPIDSVYLSCAVAKTLIQLSIILLLAAYSITKKNLLSKDLVIAAALIIPFFQINGYEDYMGIIDKSITYTFFYALPIIFPLIFFLPFYKEAFNGEAFTNSFIYRSFLIILIIIIPLSGPLNTGAMLIIGLLIFSKRLKHFLTNKGLAFFKLPRHYYYFLLPLMATSIYSLYIGSYNALNLQNKTSLVNLYLNLPMGLYNQFTQKLGFPVLFAAIIINWIILKKAKTDGEAKHVTILKYSLIFIVFYILLLPLGGYREYRPNTIRYDTMIPVTLTLIFMYTYSTLQIIQSISTKQRYLYTGLTILILSVFENADTPGFDKNDCQIQALKEIARSNKNVIKIKNDCAVLSWNKFTNPRDSELNGTLLFYWGVTTQKKLYYQ